MKLRVVLFAITRAWRKETGRNLMAKVKTVETKL